MPREKTSPADSSVSEPEESPPVPKPAPAVPAKDPLDPTRYGDWERKGVAVDF